jgi:F0F1-type ATP synthase membrane subunit a
MTAVFLYVLLLPRPMAYGFVVLAPAPLFFSPRPFDGAPGRLVLGLVLATQGIWRLTSNTSGSPLVTYAPFLLTLCVWLLVVNEHLVATASASAGRAGGPDASPDAAEAAA